ncbi:MAG: hydantoinase B/oxoprolinase family protein, partial [Microvirga sp.]
AEVALLGERGKYPPFGVAGGAPGALNRFSWGPGGVGNTPPLASKVADVRIRAGERVRLDTPGGGGWGEPRDRDRDRVARDVRLGYVGAVAAREVYEVVLAADDCAGEQPTALRDRNDA